MKSALLNQLGIEQPDPPAPEPERPAADANPKRWFFRLCFNHYMSSDGKKSRTWGALRPCLEGQMPEGLTGEQLEIAQILCSWGQRSRWKLQNRVRVEADRPREGA